MARDYKSRANSPKGGKSTPVSGWVWFLCGLLLGLLVSGLAWLKLVPHDPGSASPPAMVKQKPKDKPKKSKKTSEASAPKPRFDFYTILPEMEVVVPDPEPEEVAPSASSSGGVVRPPAAERAAAADYMLQMGSFRKLSDADRLKASMALVGLEAEIQKVTINGGDTFHRVRSGPYTRKQVNSLRARLKENKINSLVIKMKK
ncbi:MAG: SPOR domain-containing protein [Candidatus Sedimenticola sp. (ex Thyasira tokunagai)]